MYYSKIIYVFTYVFGNQAVWMGYPPHNIQSQKRSPHRSPPAGILRVRRRGELLVLKNMQSWLADLASNRSNLTGARFFRNWKLDQGRFVYDMERIVNDCKGKTIYIYLILIILKSHIEVLEGNTEIQGETGMAKAAKA